MVSPGSTGTTPEQRMEVLSAYRRWRGYGYGSAEALAHVRMWVEAACFSAGRERERRRARDDWRGVADHAVAAAHFAACLRYLDQCLQPRVDAWNTPREPDMLEALGASLERSERPPTLTPTTHHPDARVIVGNLLGMPVEFDPGVPDNEIHYRKADGSTALLMRLR